ncbi:hypothetical protein GHT07_14345 [Caenimonas koreensis DSM 17982]|uniref:Uncharacterized protein n=1 Tax=Caenimonas koreensis DSM 17982 TaxID=1121255 RepID=A0A844AWK6_9BURK|nr:hypothetical protein [Caenimonas koreensis]MRD48464.1 hypothetical protein [Caenimonas koreensis DSM 17982]
MGPTTNAGSGNRGRPAGTTLDSLAQMPQGGTVPNAVPPDNQLEFPAGAATVARALAPLAPLAPLQRLTLYSKRDIAEFLSTWEAVWLMLASKDMHAAIKDDPWLRLYEIAHSFASLEYTPRMQAVDAELATLRCERQADMATELPEATAFRIPLVGRSITLKKSPAAKALKAKEKQRSERERALKAQRDLLPREIDALVPGVESVVFHFATERLAAERHEGPRPMRPAAAAVSPFNPTNVAPPRLHGAIERGNVELVRACLREYLGVSQRLLPNAAKVAWLRAPKGIATLEDFGWRPCGDLELLERQQYEAIAAYVEEIVSSPRLSIAEKRQLCVMLDSTAGPNPQDRVNIVQLAIKSKNPGVACAVLLGIHESSASAADKQALMADIGASTAGLVGCVDEVIAGLELYQHRARDWVDGITARLHQLRSAAPVMGEAKV